MNIYIRSTHSISPQNSFGHPPTPGATPSVAPGPTVAPAPGTRLKCIEPDYKAILDPKLIRRMSRIIKMGAATAQACLQEAGEQYPEAIITGTAYGCLEDTGLFLTSMIERNEVTLQPATFIQSTHNTVGAQIALLLQCTRYNNTFVHRGLSFESALLDAVLLLQEGDAANVLVGAVDEITDTSHALLTRFGLYRRGTIAGEGATFFLLASQPGENDYARLEGMTTFYKPNGPAEIERQIHSFLAAHAIDPDSIDLVITGNNGDWANDSIYRQLESSIFKDKPSAPYKHLCGEYPTSTAFALWMAANMVRTGTRRILIYNHYLSIHHSLFLLSA
jgi:3-oxoacyl-[acyl-carrier-protein] synthase II